MEKKTIKTVELEKSAMAFKLEDGSMLLISESDVKELATKLVVEMMINEQSAIYMLKDADLERCSLLYKVVTEQGESMPKTTKEGYLKRILKLLSSSEAVVKG